MNTFLEDLDFADDLCLLSTNRLNMQEKTSKLQETALSVGLKINVAKTKVMSLHDKSSKTPITLNGDNILEVEDFTYLGTIISQDNGTTNIYWQGSTKPESHFVSCDQLGNQHPYPEPRKSEYTTVMSNQSCYMEPNVGESLNQTLTSLQHSITHAFVKYAGSSGQEPSVIKTYIL